MQPLHYKISLKCFAVATKRSDDCGV